MKYLDNPSRWRIASWIRDGCQNILAKVKEIQCNCDRAPADGYIARMFEFASKPERPTLPVHNNLRRSEDVQAAQKADGGTSMLKFLHFWYRLLPNYKFILIGLVSFFMLAAICLQPVPFLVGPTNLSYHWRIASWLVSVVATTMHMQHNRSGI
jgi:hypothetical protein